MTDPPAARRVRVDGHGLVPLLSSSPAVLLFRGGSYGAWYARARNGVLAAGAALVLSFAKSKFGASAHVLRLDGGASHGRVKALSRRPVCLVWRITNALYNTGVHASDFTSRG
jgi:hypothetical protein